jgi:chemotaxis protein methyltransferase WspC
MKRVEHLLRKTIGLDAASVGATAIHRAVRMRMRSLGLGRLEDYEQFLEKSRAEWNELVESVIVSEAFGALVRLVLEEWLPSRAPGPMRLLSLPCASGEEPYSVAMALLDAGLAPEKFQIEAVDISTRALARAERGIYGKNSFRGKDLAFRDRYFQPSAEGYILAPTVRQCVHFSQGNLFNDGFLPGHTCYDFIFCRSLLIYFDRPTQRRAIAKIERRLAPSGVLFVNPVEQPLVLTQGFVSVHIPRASACRKAGHALRGQRLARLAKRPGIPTALRPDGEFQRLLPSSGGLRLPTAGRPSPSARADLETARRLADAGRLSEAAEICQAHLRSSRVSAQAYYLLGLVRDANGDTNAIDYYRKALYLEPNHYESLLQMALLLQKSGDPARARTFRSRAQRVKART